MNRKPRISRTLIAAAAAAAAIIILVLLSLWTRMLSNAEKAEMLRDALESVIEETEETGRDSSAG